MRRVRDDGRMSPILRDIVRGQGGLGSGKFTTNGTEGFSYDPTSNVLGTEAGVPLVTENDVQILIS